jgi:hypothetical protein
MSTETSVVDTWFDRAESWAVHGLKVAAQTLDKGARALESVAERLEKKVTPPAEALQPEASR